MKIDLVILLTAITLNLSLTVFVFLRNPRNLVNRAFSLFGTTIILWTACNYLADHMSTNNLAYTRLTLAMGVCLGLSIVLLTLAFPKKMDSRPLYWHAFLVTTILVGLLSFTNYTVISVAKNPEGVSLRTGSFYLFYTLYLGLTLVISAWNLIRQYKRSSSIESNQIKLFAIGLFSYASLALLSNAILPAITDSWSSSRFGPIFTVPFVALTAYSIIKHGLFDIRLGITRIIGFLATVSLAATLYAVLILTLGASFVSFRDLSGVQLFVLITSVVLFGLTFRYLQEYIAELSQRIFYQDSYDLRATLDDLSDALITSNKTDEIIQKSLKVISEAIKPSNYYVVILGRNSSNYTEFSFKRKAIVDAKSFLELLKSNFPSLITRDLLLPDNVLGMALGRENVSLLLRLGTRASPTGLIFFGNKINGSIYATQDMNLLRIAAKNMSLAVENAKKYDQIIHFADTLKDEVDKATVKLRKANTRLKSLDVLKNDFISMASHQLRSPATSVYEALHMLNHPALSKRDRDELIELAEANSERLVTVVKTMLNMARIQAGKFTIDKSEEDISNLVDKVISETGIVASQREIKLIVNKPSQPLIKSIDVAKIHEAMANYIENAIKYSPKKSTVKIDLYTTDNKLVFEVQDSGMGVPVAEREHLFGKFYRATNARVEEPDGNGIGLYVVRNIATGHGGEAYYRPLEQGSLFGLWIPLEHHKNHR